MVLRTSEGTILVGVEGVVYCDISLIGVTRGRDVTVGVTGFKMEFQSRCRPSTQ